MKRVIALGFFDGVHLGHGALLQLARRRADALGCKAAALTFDRHPDQVVFGRETPLISTVRDRSWAMTHLYGMDEVLVVHFDRAMMELPWESFVEDMLVRRYGAVHVICGSDFTFGHLGQGNAARLREMCASLGVGCDVVDKVSCGGSIISSTLIRQLLQDGRMEQANALLGHPHFVSGPVIHGKQLGRKLGFPTANLAVAEGVLVPAHGVYAGKVELPDGRRFMAVTNVGVCPTVGEGYALRVEPWLLDFSEDLYDQVIRVEFYRHLRPECKFESLDQLKAMVQHNARQTRDFFAQFDQAEKDTPMD